MLRYTADIRTLFFVAVYFSLLALAWVSVDLSAIEWVWAVPLFAAICVTSFQGAVSTHNAVHCPIFKNRTLNKFWQIVLTLTYGHPVSSYVPGHNLSHHKHMQTRRDVMRTTKVRFRYNLLNLFLFMPSIVPSIMRADSTYAKSMRLRHPKWFRQLLVEGAALWTIQIALLVLDWRKALIFWVVPHLYAQWGIVTMNLLQHDGCDEKSDYNHSRNFVSRIINFWTFNNGFHTLHHITPGLHWSLLPAAHAEQIAPHIHPNLDQSSLVVYLFKTYLLGRRLTYDGKPLDLEPAGADEEWIPHPRETPDDLGAVDLEELNSQIAHQIAT